MKSYFFLIYINYVGVYSKNYIVHLPGPKSRRMMDNVMWRVIKPLRTVSGASNRGIELHLLKNPHPNSIHTPSPKPQDQNTFSIARAMTGGGTRSQPETNLNKTSDSETTSETSKKLANKDDLFKGLNELVEKRIGLHKCSNNHLKRLPKTTQSKQNPPIIITSINRSEASVVKASNLDEILEILKGGVTFDKIPEPTTENVLWMRIKIPKSTK